MGWRDEVRLCANGGVMIAITILALIILMGAWAGIRDAYDEEQWRIGTPDYCRYGATNREVIVWAWKRWAR